MIENLSLTTSSIDKVEMEPLSSFYVEPQPTFTPKDERINKKGSLDSSEITKSECILVHSGGAMPEKPSIVQENVLDEDKWYGRILEVEEETLILDLRNAYAPQNRLKLRVRKDIVEGELKQISLGTSVIVSYQRVRNYQDKVKKRLSVRLREPVEMPENVLENEYEARKKRFSYMFAEG